MILMVVAILGALFMLGSIATIKSCVILVAVMMGRMGSLASQSRMCRLGQELMSMRNRNDRLIYSAFASVKYNISNNIQKYTTLTQIHILQLSLQYPQFTKTIKQQKKLKFQISKIPNTNKSINKQFQKVNKIKQIKVPNSMADNELYNQFSQPTDIPTKLINQITNGTLIIPDQPKQLNIKQSHSSGQLDLDGSRRLLIQKVRKSKDQTIKELRELELQEKQLKEAIRRMNYSSESKKKKMERSQFTEMEKERIKSIIKNTKIKQQLKNKQHQILLQSLTNELRKQREQEQQIVQKLREQHKKTVQQNLITLQKRKKIREQSNRQVNRRMLELRQKKYIHTIKAKQDEQIKQRKQQQIENKLEQIKSRFRLDFEEITEHQKIYQEIMERKSQERRERFKTENNKGLNTSRKYSTNMFVRMLEEEEKEKKLEQIRKQNKAKQLRSKVEQYKQIVRQKHMPRLTTQSRSKSIESASQQKQKSRIKKAHALSHKQIVQKGNEYLKQARKLRKQKDDQRIVTQPQIIKYADYLKTMNKKSKKSGTVQQFRSIVNKEDSIDYSSAYKAKNLVQQMEAKSKKTKDDKLFESIQNKIDLLKVLL